MDSGVGWREPIDIPFRVWHDVMFQVCTHTNEYSLLWFEYEIHHPPSAHVCLFPGWLPYFGGCGTIKRWAVAWLAKISHNPVPSSISLVGWPLWYDEGRKIIPFRTNGWKVPKPQSQKKCTLSGFCPVFQSLIYLSYISSLSIYIPRVFLSQFLPVAGSIV